MRIEGNKIIIDEQDFLGGFPPQPQDNSSVKIGNGFGFAANFNPYRYLGYALPGHLGIAPTNADQFSGVIKAGDFDGNNTNYLIDTNGLLQAHTVSSHTIIKTGGTFPYTINHAHASEIPDDCIIYKHNVASVLTSSFFYSFNDATDFDIGCYVGLTGTPDDDFMSQTGAGAVTTPLTGSYLTGGKSYPHPMIVGEDGLLYIGSGRYLHAYDGEATATGTFNAAFLTFPPNFVITSFTKHNGLLIIGGSYTGALSTNYQKASIFTWNYLDADPTQEYELNEKLVGTVFVWNGRLTVVTSGDPGLFGRIRVKQYIGNSFTTVAEINATIPSYRSFCFKSKQLWLNCGGKIYSVGTPFSDSYELNQLTTLTNSTGSGCLMPNLVANGFFGGGTTCFDSLENTSNYHSAGEMESKAIMPLFTPGKKGKVKYIDLYFQNTASGGRPLEITLRVDADSTTKTIFSTATIALPLIKHIVRDTSDAPFPMFAEIKVNLQWQNSGASTSIPPMLSKIVIEYEEVLNPQ